MSKQDVLQALEQNHDRFLAAVNRIPDQEKGTRVVAGDWTPKDLLAHVTRWENVCAGYLDKLANGEPMPMLEGTSDQLNARWAAEDRNLSLDEVWQNSDASALRVRAMVESLTDGTLARSLRGPWPELTEEMPLSRIIGLDTFEHYLMHVKDLQSSAAGQEPASGGADNDAQSAR